MVGGHRLRVPALGRLGSTALSSCWVQIPLQLLQTLTVLGGLCEFPLCVDLRECTPGDGRVPGSVSSPLTLAPFPDAFIRESHAPWLACCSALPV